MTRLHRRLAAVERRRGALMDALAREDPGLLSYRPGDGGWSVLEIVEHLILAEREVLRPLWEPSLLRDREPSFRSRAGYHVVMFVLRFGVPVKVPAASMNPSGGSGLDALRARWEDNHRVLRGFLDTLGPGEGRRALFRHPVSGPLTVAQALAMLDVHFRRHRGQIHRTLWEARGRRVPAGTRAPGAG